MSWIFRTFSYANTDLPEHCGKQEAPGNGVGGADKVDVILVAKSLNQSAVKLVFENQSWQTGNMTDAIEVGKW